MRTWQLASSSEEWPTSSWRGEQGAPGYSSPVGHLLWDKSGMQAEPCGLSSLWGAHAMGIPSFVPQHVVCCSRTAVETEHRAAVVCLRTQRDLGSTLLTRLPELLPSQRQTWPPGQAPQGAPCWACGSAGTSLEGG